MIDTIAPDIQLVDIRLLEHHPKNPRSDLGDLKELTESIRHNGILQNLTLVPRTDGQYGYWVLIGNRRLEAARQAGLTALPCVYCEMSEAEQIATMLAENMQRSDLTLTDQACGVQMMMDLGLTVKEIARETGLSRTTIDRRAKLLQYDRQTVNDAINRGGTLMDFLMLEKVEDEEQRSKLAGKIGTNNFRADLSSVLQEQKDRIRREAICRELDKFATRMTAYDELNGVKLNTEYVRSISLNETAESIKPPEDVRERRYYYYARAGITLYRERLASNVSAADNMSDEDRKKDRLRLLNRERIDQMKSMSERHRALRREFVLGLNNIKRVHDKLFSELLNQIGANDGSTYLYANQLRLIEELMGIGIVKDNYNRMFLDQEQLTQAITEDPDRTAILLIYCILDTPGKDTQYYDEVLLSNCTYYIGRHKPSPMLDRLYRILTTLFDYPMSDEERQMQTGEHPVFGPVEG